MTFELLVPLGLLGLIGIAVLILIYVIRPNYQARHVTSTYIWKLSLGYKRRRPPVNKIRNIIIFLCQLLILASMAMIMAWPALVDRPEVDENDVIYIIDSSASMYTEKDGLTRFDRAINEVEARAGAVLDADGRVSVIVANNAPDYLLSKRLGITRKEPLMNALEELRDKGASYDTSDIEAALSRTKEVLTENSNAQIVLFTDAVDPEKTYIPDERISVVSVRDEEEWNAAILDAKAEREDGYYTVTVRIACYGVSQALQVNINVEGASLPGSETADQSIEFFKMVDCSDDAVKTVVFRVGGGAEDENLFYYDIGDKQKFFAFRSIQVSIEADDYYAIDNHFSIYGGQKQRLRVQYFSSLPNPFTQTALAIARNAVADNYDLDITEIKQGDEPAGTGFDLYVYEHEMPKQIPTDGAVILLDPINGELPSDVGFRVEGLSNFTGDSFTLAEGDAYEGHPVTRYVIASDIEVSLYDRLVDCDPSYDVLLSYDGSPLLMVKNDGAAKIAVMAFSVHYSNLSQLPENFLLMYSIIDYFYPSIISGNAFEVGEEFTLNTWGDELTFNGTNTVFKAEEMPKNFSIDTPGSYYFEQKTYYGKTVSAEVFIKPPAEESDICKVVESISNPYADMETETVFRDLLIILASILVGLLFLEWFLQSRESK